MDPHNIDNIVLLQKLIWTFSREDQFVSEVTLGSVTINKNYF